MQVTNKETFLSFGEARSNNAISFTFVHLRLLSYIIKANVGDCQKFIVYIVPYRLLDRNNPTPDPQHLYLLFAEVKYGQAGEKCVQMVNKIWYNVFCKRLHNRYPSENLSQTQ